MAVQKSEELLDIRLILAPFHRNINYISNLKQLINLIVITHVFFFLNYFRRSPISVAAAVIYIITQLSNEKRSLKGTNSVFGSSLFAYSKPCDLNNATWLIAEISIATNVAEGTIKNSCKDLQPHLTRIIPSWYATEADLRNQTNA